MNAIEAALSGRVEQEPELRHSKDSGKPWLPLNAVGEGDATQWVRLSVFGEKAEQLAAALHRGDRVYCEGTLTLQRWTDQAGAERSGLNVAAWRCIRLGRLASAGRARPAAAVNRRQPSRSPFAGRAAAQRLRRSHGPQLGEARLAAPRRYSLAAGERCADDRPRRSDPVLRGAAMLKDRGQREVGNSLQDARPADQPSERRPGSVSV
jgi:single-stranded DNA-binding protein